MLAAFLLQCLGFAIQTVILFGLLWLMIKIQKLDQRFEFRFPGVLGAAALATGLNLALKIILGHFIGLYLAAALSAPIAFIVLLYRFKKATGADYVDSLFTIAIARALLLVINLFLLAALMGNLQARLHKAAEFETVTLRPRIKAESPAVIPTNAPVLPPNPPAAIPAAAPVKPVPERPAEPAVPHPAPILMPVTNPPPQGPPTTTNPVAQPAPAKPAPNLSKYFSVKGVTRNGANSAATIQTGTKIYTVFLEEAALMQTVDGPISVRFAELGGSTVTLELNGEPAKFPIPKP
jgi:hypothetical protein